MRRQIKSKKRVRNLEKITTNLCLDRKNKKVVKKTRNLSHLQTNQWRIETTATIAKTGETSYVVIIVQGLFILRHVFKNIVKKII